MTLLPDAYFAGHFDGEGCLSNGEGCLSMGFRNNCAMPRLQVQSTSAWLPTLEAYQVRFGGRIHKQTLRTSKQAYAWCPSGLVETLSFLKSIHPYSTEKRGQVETAIQWLEYRLQSPLFGEREPFDECFARAIFDRLKKAKTHEPATKPMDALSLA